MHNIKNTKTTSRKISFAKLGNIVLSEIRQVLSKHIMLVLFLCGISRSCPIKIKDKIVVTRRYKMGTRRRVGQQVQCCGWMGEISSDILFYVE